jgi:CubicO group peptidase (beta-lactamase class C family)
MRQPLLNRRVVLTTMAMAPAGILLPRIVLAAATDVGHVQALLDDYVAKRKLAGAIAAIGGPDGSRFVSSGRIALDNQAARCGPDSLWRIYSMTKLVTGAAAMLLLDEGKFTLDTPVGEFFPSFQSSRVLIDPNGPETRSARSSVTIRHLMTHSAGLLGSALTEPPLGPLYLDRRLNVARVSLEMEATVQHQDSLLAFAEAAGTVPLAFDPGTKWSYSLSSDVLGAVVEKVSGMPFERFLEQRLFAPLGMTDTAFMVSASRLRRLATSYEVSKDGLRVVDAPPQSVFAQAPPFPYPSSGLVSSARDFARFAGMLLEEGSLGSTRVLTSPTARLMMSNLLPEGVRADFGMGWGAGGAVLMASIPVATPVGMTEGTYGWHGAAGTVCWVDRARRMFVVLMTQYMPSEAYNLQTEFTAAVFADRPAGAIRKG